MPRERPTREWGPNPAYDSGIDRLNAGDPEAAIELLSTALSVQPKRARIHSNLGFVLQSAGRHDDACAAAERGVALRDGDPYPLRMAAQIYFDQQKYPRAYAHAEAAWAERERLDPPYVGEVGEILAYARNDEDQWRAALAIVDEALCVAPDRGSLHAARANCLALGQRWGEARRAVEEGLALKPGDEYLLDRLRIVEKGLAQVTAALEEARLRTTASPKSWEAWHDLGAALWMSGDGLAAADAFTRARSLHPDPRYRRSSASMLSQWEADCRLFQLGSAKVKTARKRTRRLSSQRGDRKK